MKKICAMPIAVLLFVFLSHALAQDINNKTGWAIGTWKGFVGGQQNDWTLEIKTIDNVVTTDGIESIEAKGSFRFKEGKPGNIAVKLTNSKMVFNAWGKEDYTLERVNEKRMEGIKKNPDGKEYKIRFWKLDKKDTAIDNTKNNPFFAAWEGFCRHGRMERFTVEHIDNTAATIRFEWGILMDKSNNIKEGWRWENASISPSNELKIDEGNIFTIFKLSKNKQYLEGEMFNGDKTIDSITLSKTDQTAPSSSTEQNVPEPILAFVGTWEGSWGVGISRLIVEKMNLREAVCVYSWPDNPNGSSKGGQIRLTGKVDEKKGAILWVIGGKKFSFTMDKDLKTIYGRAEAPSGFSNTTMKKIN